MKPLIHFITLKSLTRVTSIVCSLGKYTYTKYYYYYYYHEFGFILHECEMRTRTVNNENIFLVEIPPAYLYFPRKDVYFVILAWHICSLLDMFKKNPKFQKPNLKSFLSYPMQSYFTFLFRNLGIYFIFRISVSSIY